MSTTRTLLLAMAAYLAGCASDSSRGTLEDSAGPKADQPDAQGTDAQGTDARSIDGGLDASGPGLRLLVVDHVTVVDGDGARPASAVLVDRDRNTIVDVAPADGPWPAGAKVLDGQGRFLVPALADPHVHLTYSGASVWTGDPLAANLRASLYHGVTAVMDVGGSEVTFALRQAIADGKVLGPTVRATGPFLTAAGSHPCESSPFNDCRFVTAADALIAAQGLVAAGADALKVALADAAFTPWPTPRLDVAALAQVATAGVPVVAHVDSNQDTVDAVSAGASVLAHPVFSAPLTPQALQASKSARGVHSTLGAHGAVLALVDGQTDLADDGLIVGPGVKANWQHVRDQPGALLPGWLDHARAWDATARANVSALCQQPDVALVPGSDAGYLFVPHGLGLHRELAELAALGCGSALELLDAATRRARQLIGLPGGTVAAGQPAELLLLGDDPTQDLAAALGAIEHVIHGGEIYEREALRTIDLMADGQSLAGALCLESADCALGLTCDGLAHVCRQGCPTPFSAINACGQDAWCMPADGVTSAIGGGVCRPEPGAACDLYAMPSGCEQAGYSMACVPLDHDTSGCRLAGSQQPGQPCSYGGDGSSCAPGLYCSVVDGLCYRLCDSAASVDGCPPGTSCQTQPAGPGVDWFGLCL